MHSSNKYFTDDKVVTQEDFNEYHNFVSAQIERDCEFRNFIIGVWNMDVRENLQPDTRTHYNDTSIAGKKAVAFPAKNSHEQWKHDFHRSQFAQPTIIEHPTKEAEVHAVPMRDNTAGIRQTDFPVTKGINVTSDATRSPAPVIPDYKNNADVRKWREENNQAQQQNQLELAQRVAKKIRSRGARGILGLGRSFRIIDDDNSGHLSYDEFAKALRDYRISTEDHEIQAIIEIFDHDKSGEVSYDEFIRTIVGEMNEFRRNLAMQAFAKMDRDGSGRIDINDIKIVYTAKKHPDVMMGYKTEEEILYEFLDTFEQHFAIKHPEARDHVIEMPEWLEYYNNVSCNIDHDEYFELMMRNAYKF